MSETSPLGITELVLRDAHQSLLATRLRIDDMLPMAEKLDRVGFWSMESWGGATFDACIRYLGEDPWERIRRLKAAMPNTRQQMLLRGQNLLGYRHYADDVVRRFVERAAANGVDVFRIFDAMNDMRNLETAIRATLEVDRHAQGTIAYTVSPVHTEDLWVDQAKRIQDMGAHSVCIKDMAGLLRPYTAFELVSRLKEALEIPVHMQCHATTGMSTGTYLKAIEAGIDNVDTAVSSMSMTYGHSATESLVAILQDTPRDTRLDIHLIEEIAAYFRQVRRKYARFEGALRGVDSRILVAQVPGGMLTNLENQLREQNAGDRLDEVLEEIPRVRKELGYIPLVTPTSQIVGTQAVINVLTGERYKSITRETEGVLKGEYGATPAEVDGDLRQRVLRGGDPVTCRPADLLEPELDNLTAELDKLTRERGLTLADERIDDVLTYALFPQVGLKFIEHRGDPSAFEPPPGEEDRTAASAESRKEVAGAVAAGPATYDVKVNGRAYRVEVAESGALADVRAQSDDRSDDGSAQSEDPGAGSPAGEAVPARLAGTIVKVLVSEGERVTGGQPLLVLEAMKMETEMSAPRDGQVAAVHVSAGDAVAVGDPLVTLD